MKPLLIATGVEANARFAYNRIVKTPTKGRQMFLLLKAFSWYQHHSEQSTRDAIFNNPPYPSKATLNAPETKKNQRSQSDSGKS
jgi:tRNA1(Val) A37 N6-methylase TrmN6